MTGTPAGAIRSLSQPPTPLRRAWRRLRRGRRVSFTRGGALFAAGTLAVGFLAIGGGNNLLHLIFGALLGFILVSLRLSEGAIGKLEVHRRTPRGTPIDTPVRILYEVRKPGRRRLAHSVELTEEGLPTTAYLPKIPGGESATTFSEHRFVQRGVHPLELLTISTSFPFGLLRRCREVLLRGELVIWPRTDREVRRVAAPGGRARRMGIHTAGSIVQRGEYRALRGYRPGDDPRDIHWRTTARLGKPLVREYDQDDSETLEICLDTRGPPGKRAEVTVEVAASLAARAFREGKRFSLHTPTTTIRPDLGTGQLEAVLDALARADFDPDSPPPAPPTGAGRCVLVTMSAGGTARFGDVLVTPDGSKETE